MTEDNLEKAWNILNEEGFQEKCLEVTVKLVKVFFYLVLGVAAILTDLIIKVGTWSIGIWESMQSQKGATITTTDPVGNVEQPLFQRLEQVDDLWLYPEAFPLLSASEKASERTVTIEPTQPL